MSSFLIFGLIKRPEWRYCIGQKVCSHFSIPSCEKTCTNLLANPVFLSQYSMFPISACFPTTSLTNEPSATVFKTSHCLSNLGCYFEFLYIYNIYILIYMNSIYIKLHWRFLHWRFNYFRHMYTCQAILKLPILWHWFISVSASVLSSISNMYFSIWPAKFPSLPLPFQNLFKI